MKIKEVIQYLESIAPPSYQESYDNSGLICGNSQQTFRKAIICLDSTEAVIDEAIAKNANLVIAHHPIVFKGLKTFTGKNYVERTIIKAIKNDIAIYAIHTNLDNVQQGVNAIMAQKIGLENTRILAPKSKLLQKIAFFTPKNDMPKVRKALFDIGAGQIGNYNQASFNTKGIGTFKGNENSTPQKGEKLQFHEEEEIKTEILFPAYLKNKVVQTLQAVHPYEEVAYDIFSLENQNQTIGAGMIGKLATPQATAQFFQHLKKQFNCTCIRHTEWVKPQIQTVAICGGAGSFLLRSAIAQQADIFITGDFKYHEFFDAENHTIIADIGHFESEQYTKELLFGKLTKKFPTFAFLLTEVNTNPVKYFV